MDAPERWPSKLRVVTSFFCLAACITFMALLVHSIYWNDTIFRHHETGYWHLRSWKGQVDFHSIPFTEKNTPSFGVVCTPTERWQALLGRYGGRQPQRPKLFAFKWGENGAESIRVVAPDWFFAIGFGALAFAFRPKPRLKMSLRELLIITTFTVVMLGALESLHRWAPDHQL